MTTLTRLFTAALFVAALGGTAVAEPPPAAVGNAPEPLWFEAPAVAAAPKPVARRAAKPRIKLSAKKNRYGNISLESLAARERGKPAVACAASCVERQLVRKPKALRRDKRASDMAQASQLYR
ncbi:MAG TPA: hypothetical protein VIG06_01865 [Kofleriaceae bacterium]|jgi:hypothetical protein